MRERFKTVLILFIPAIIINLIFTVYIPFFIIPRELWRSNPAKAIENYLVIMYTTGMVLWPIMQVIYGLYAYRSLRLRGYSNDEIFGFSMFKQKLLRNVIIIIILIGIAEFLFFAESLINMALYSMTYEEYWGQFIVVVSRIPYWLRLFTWLVGPFTAGIFEELFFRAYGIRTLEEAGTSKIKANLIQAIAFGLWHGLTMHALITFLIGFTFGYFYELNEKKTLITLITAHWIIDFIGFTIYITI